MDVVDPAPAVVALHVLFDLEPVVQLLDAFHSEHRQGLPTFEMSGLVDYHNSVAVPTEHLLSQFAQGVVRVFADLKIELIHGDLLTSEPVVCQEPLATILAVVNEQLLAFSDEPFGSHDEGLHAGTVFIVDTRVHVVVHHVGQRHQHLGPLVVHDHVERPTGG